jgi:Flp pilus assembly protein CpaB
MGKTDAMARDMTTRQQISNMIVSKRQLAVLNKMENDDLQWKGSEQGHGMGNDLKDDQR